MIFLPTEIAGVFTVELDKRQDDRGFFARSWCEHEFADQGLPTRIAQMNISFNRRKHTLRGFHYQVAPHQEDKLLRCVHGAVFDVVVDLRPESQTYMSHITLELSAANCRMVMVPKGCANAFLTLDDETEVIYLVSEFYHPLAERGVRWNDPAFAISWPAEPTVISDKDRGWRDFTPVQARRLATADQE